MASEREALQRWLRQGVVVGNDVAVFELEEKEQEAKLKKVQISGLDAGCIILKPDAARADWFKGDGPNKRCDYLILTEWDNRKYAFFIELKSERYDLKDIAKQFKGTICFLDYCVAVIGRFENPEHSLDEYEHRFVVFYKLSMTKPTSRPQRPSPNLKPDLPMLFPNPERISVAQMIG